MGDNRVSDILDFSFDICLYLYLTISKELHNTIKEKSYTVETGIIRD